MSTDPATPSTDPAAIERATYNIHDDRLMFWPARRLTPEEYEESKRIGFVWWPGRKVFTCTWRPHAEDFICKLGGDIEEADTIDDLEDRVARFEQRAERATEDAAATADYLANRANTQRRRENAAARVTKAIGTAEHWQRRIAGAIHHAARRERPDVIHRRIRGLEADRRRHENSYTVQTDGAKYGSPDEVYVGANSRGGSWVKKSALPGIEAWAKRWIEHIDRRLEYERALLEASGGLAAQKFAIAVGGEVLVSTRHNDTEGTWLRVVRVNKGASGIVSVTIGPKPQGMWTDMVKYEHIRDYRPPSAEGVKAAKAAKKLPPLVNYRGKDFIEMTKAEYDRREHRTIVVKATTEHGAHRQRETWHPDGGFRRACVFITDAPVKERPLLGQPEAEPDLLRKQAEDEIAEAQQSGTESGAEPGVTGTGGNDPEADLIAREREEFQRQLDQATGDVAQEA